MYADWYEGAANRPAMLVLIGKTSSKMRFTERVSYLSKSTGFSALVLDYSGHGVSPFELDDITPAQHFIEVVAAYDYMKLLAPQAKVVVFGTSYGGYFSSLLPSFRTVDALVLRVPAVYPPEIFYTKSRDIDTDHIRSVYRTDQDNFMNHPDLEKLKIFKGPSLVVSHELDDVCPKPVTDAYIRVLRADSFDQPGFKHSESQTSPEQAVIHAYLDKITAWLNSLPK